MSEKNDALIAHADILSSRDIALIIFYLSLHLVTDFVNAIRNRFFIMQH